MTTVQVDRTNLDCLVSVDHHGQPRVYLQVGDDRTTAHSLRHVAHTLEQDGNGITVTPPAPGEAVMPCADCRRMLDTSHMHTVDAGSYGNGDPKLGRIVCTTCANKHARATRRNRAW